MLKTYYALICMAALAACNTQQPATPSAQPMTVDELVKKQVLLTNYAEFTGDRTLNGASAFLLSYVDSIYAVTATHLIGPDGGVEPAVPVTSLAANLLQWKMYPRQPVNPATDTITATANQLDYSKSTSDLLLLKTIAPKQGIQPLQANFELPKLGDTLYLIGCPYSEENCKQNVYKMTFAETNGEMLVSEIFSGVELSGLSGAPVVDTEGRVLGVLKGSMDVEGKHYVWATSIREIQKIK